MSVNQFLHVTSMLIAPTPVGVLIALVDLDIAGMDSPVMVCCMGQSLTNVYDLIFLLPLAIPPPIALLGSGMVNVGRAFRLTCQSIGDFSGNVVWMKDGESIPSIGLCSRYLYYFHFVSSFHFALPNFI